MPFLVVGLSHRTAPIEVREKLAFSREQLGDVASRLRALPGVDEGMLLSTCNRTEVLVAPGDGLPREGIVRSVRDLLSATRAIDPEELDRYLYAHQEADAVRHVFRVASSLDSMMVGVSQILGK